MIYFYHIKMSSTHLLDIFMFFFLPRCSPSEFLSGQFSVLSNFHFFCLLQGGAGPVGDRGETGGPGEKVVSYRILRCK